MSTLLIQIVIAAVLFAAGGATGIKWQLGVQARAQLAAADARATDAKQQIKAIDKASAAHVATLANINNQLGNAREQIAKLSGRECFSAGTVRLLNAIGSEPGAAAASQPASAPAAAAPAGDERFATEADTARAIAICRASYSAVAGQLNQILDIEDKRHPPE